jgi:hypothetical protein
MSQEPEREHVLDLHSFHDLKASLPATKMGDCHLAPRNSRSPAAGPQNQGIWESLTNDGFQMTYDLFRLYLSRARRKIAQFNGPTLTAPPEAGESIR